MKVIDIVDFNPVTRLPNGESFPFVEMASLPVSGRDIPSYGSRIANGSGSKFKNGDTLLARITPCLENGKGGIVRDLPGEGVGHGSTEFIVMRPRTASDADFVYYLSRLPDFRTFAIQQMTGTSGRQRVSWQALVDFELPDLDPDRREQVGSTLAALDDKIELNRRMNETLEAMARAIFKDWFVDFGPTRAKAEGGPPYLAPDLWSLFPDALDDADKPVGWRTERIGAHVTVQKGLSYKGAGLTDQAGGVPLHNLNSVLEGGGYKNDGLKFYLGEYKPRHIARPGDLIVANTEQGFDHLLIGYSALVPSWVGREGLFSHHIFKVEPRTRTHITRRWLHFALSASPIGEAVRRFSNGTTVNMLPADAFDLPELVVPPSALVERFDETVMPMLAQQEKAVMESRTLAQTRDLLLPKLMSGEIRLADAEKAVEAVA